MNQAIYVGDADAVRAMTEQGLAAGRSAQEVLNNGLIAGMSVVGEDFKYNRLYLPEVLVAARAMKAGMAILEPLLSSTGSPKRSAGTIVMGTVKGDLHDIGKNIVCMMAEGAGFKVVDLGTDTPIEDFVAAVQEHNAQIVGMSALLTTTMLYMKKVVQAFNEQGLGHVKMCVGGAPVSQMFADEIGADGYGANASVSVDLFKTLLEESGAD